MGILTQHQYGILDAALPLFTARGYGRVTMADIAHSAGISRRTLYDRFPSKADILIRLLQQLGRRATTRYCAATATMSTQVLADVLTDMVDTNLAAVLLLDSDIRHNDPPLWRHLERWRHRALRAALAALLTRAASAGLLRPTIETTLARIVLEAAFDAPFLIAGTEPVDPRSPSIRLDILSTLSILLEGLIASNSAQHTQSSEHQ